MKRPERVRRVDDSGKRMHGYIARAVIDGRVSQTYFSDRRYGSLANSYRAAVLAVEGSLTEHLHYLSLKRRYLHRSNSPADVPGVNRISSALPSQSDYWLARWLDQDGCRRYRKFGVRKYGEIEAYELAIAARLEATAEERERYRTLSKTVSDHRFRHVDQHTDE